MRTFHEALAIEVGTSLRSEQVVRVLERVAHWLSYPQRIRIDNGPEFISTALDLMESVQSQIRACPRILE